MDQDLVALVKRLKEDPLFYFEHCLKIQEFGTGQTIPFKLNEVQLIMHHMMQRQLKNEGHVRMIVLKARRFGISTYTQARYFHHTATNRNRICHICTHSKAATDTMFGMTRMMEQNLPAEIKPQMKYSGKRELFWGSEDGGLNSQYTLSTTGGREVRGSKIDYLHCSEVASWGEGGEDYLLGLLNCVVQGYGTEAVIESTAQGVGGVFHDMYWDAARGDSGWEAVFFPWYIFSDYQRPFEGEDERKRFEDDLGNDPRYGGEEELNLLGVTKEYDIGLDEPLTFEVTLEKLNWRRNTIKTQCQNSLPKLKQEYPATDREAFQASGRSVFDMEVLSNMVLASEKRQREQPAITYHIPVKSWRTSGRHKDAMNYLLEAAEDGQLAVWEKPRVGHEYRIGVDVSEGLEVGRDTDWSVAVVLDAKYYKEVATLRIKIDPDLLAWQLTALGRWYQWAQLFVERNNHGLVTLSFLRDVHMYPNLYTEKILDERSSRTARKLGFHTTVKSKPLIIDYLKELIREKQININSPFLLDELQTFVNQPNGKMGAQTGSHDDGVMALAIATFGCKLFPPSLYSPESVQFWRKPELSHFTPPQI